MKNALFLDFEDSFSFNVVQELQEIGLQVEVKLWSEFKGSEAFDLLILGPGPGHPDEYESIFKSVEAWLREGKLFLGVCLGHQIFWRIQGAKVEKSLRPVHGRKVKLKLTEEWRSFFKIKNDPWVQRYNSLCVPGSSSEMNDKLDCFIQDNEILITKAKSVLTYQFHPESIGTSYPKAFFTPLLREFV